MIKYYLQLKYKNRIVNIGGEINITSISKSLDLKIKKVHY